MALQISTCDNNISPHPPQAPVLLLTDHFGVSAAGYQLCTNNLFGCIAVVIHHDAAKQGLLAHLNPSAWDVPQVLAGLLACLPGRPSPDNVDLLLAGGGDASMGTKIMDAVDRTRIPMNQRQIYCRAFDRQRLQPRWVLYDPQNAWAVLFTSPFAPISNFFGGTTTARNRGDIYPDCQEVSAAVLTPRAPACVIH